MPKIIANVRERLLEVTRLQITTLGFSGMTIRSVAIGTGVGVGTVYNYFASKDELVAEATLEDWRDILNIASAKIEALPTTECAVTATYEALLSFIDMHKALLLDKQAEKLFATTYTKRHALLRSQLASIVSPVAKSRFGSEFFAEAIITWVSKGKELSEIMPYLIHALEN